VSFGPHALCEISGDWTDSDSSREVWTFGLRVIRSGGGHLNDPDAYIGDCYAALSAWFSNVNNQISAKARLRTLKVNNINPDGTYVDPTTHFHDYGAGVVGGAAALHPSDMSLVYSWGTSAQSRGPGARGRVYPPNPTIAMATAFSISSANQTVAVNAAKALLTVFARDSDGDGHLINPVIASRINGKINVIDQVKVGLVYDVQRRRRNRIAESYALSTYP
jgi:hypothetical protein